MKPKRRALWPKAGRVLVILGLVVIAGRLVLPTVLRGYVNRVLDRNPLYTGRIGGVGVHLWRGAYSIRDIRISRSTGNAPVPFFLAKRMDFAVEWKALLHRKLVGQIIMDSPQINFVAASSNVDKQTGEGGLWLNVLEKLFLFRINRAEVHNGSIHFRSFVTPEPVDVYLSELEVIIDDLTNIRDQSKLLVSTVHAKAMVMNQAHLEFRMTLDPFAYQPSFHLAARLLGLDVTRLNDLARAYGKFDFERGWFDFVVEADARDGQVSGYAKPLFRDLQVFSLKEDLKQGRALEAFWQALVGATVSVFRNWPRDQFGTLIPFNGRSAGVTRPDLLATVANVLRNAFVRAYLPRLEPGSESPDDLEFGPPEFIESLSVNEGI